MVRCRVSRHQLISILEDVEEIKAKIRKSSGELRKHKEDKAKLNQEEKAISKQMKAIIRSHDHASERRCVLMKEATECKTKILRKKTSMKSIEQERSALVNHCHRVNLEHSRLEREVSELFKELVQVKKERDQNFAEYEMHRKRFINKQMELQRVRENIVQVKAIMKTGIRKAVIKSKPPKRQGYSTLEGKKRRERGTEYM
ncbi:hypothetical protein AAMO2058_001634700 [Amorphochlora amoebiformis]